MKLGEEDTHPSRAVGIYLDTAEGLSLRVEDGFSEPFEDRKPTFGVDVRRVLSLVTMEAFREDPCFNGIRHSFDPVAPVFVRFVPDTTSYLDILTSVCGNCCQAREG